jgi:ATP-dependent exoDNAse (exonuclease V) beta subunit
MGKRLILKASAGTGKTYRLSLEYIASLVQGIDFKDILVMTFTKKATAEIKERILKFLQGICEDGEERVEIEKNLQKIYGEDFYFDIPKIKKIYKNIIENKEKLKIYTIDSFTNTIFKKAIAPYLKIYSYEIVDEEENKKILIKTFEKIFENREDFNLFKSFLEDNSEKNMDIYIDLIKNIINQRWKMILIGDKLDKKVPFEHQSAISFLEKMEEILQDISRIKN